METIKKLAIAISLAALLVILTFATLRCCGHVAFATYRLWTNVATVVWFVFAPFWLWPKEESETA